MIHIGDEVHATFKSADVPDGIGRVINIYPGFEYPYYVRFYGNPLPYKFKENEIEHVSSS